MRIALVMWLITALAGKVFSQTNVVSPPPNYEIAQTQVLKVYSTEENGATFRAYVVKWKDREVVVSDRLSTGNYKVGDNIEVIVMRHELGRGEDAKRVLHFEIVPRPRANKIVAFKTFESSRSSKLHSKLPSYIDCHSDKLVLYPGQTEVTWSELQAPGNALEKMLDKIQENASAEHAVVLVRPQSVKFYRMVRKMIGQRPIDVGYEAVNADFTVDWHEAIKNLNNPPQAPARATATTKAGSSQFSEINMAPRAIPTTKQAAFFECRGNEVFFVDKAGIDAQVTTVLSSLSPETKKGDIKEFLRVLKENEIGNETYRVKPEYLLTAIVALEPRVGVAGDGRQQLQHSTGKFQTALSALDPQKYYITFLVRDDSFDAFLEARIIADQRGFETGWELLGVDEPIKFGAGSGPVTPASR